MALRIRLARGGTKKRPHYNIVIADRAHAARRPLHREDRLLQSAAAVGSCRPPQAGPRSRQGLDRQGRRGVRTALHKLLANAGLVKARVHNNPQKAQPKKKAQERLPRRAKAAKAPKRLPLKVG